MCKMHPHLLIFQSSRLPVVAEVKPIAWQWKTQKEDFHRCQRPKRLRHISLRLKSQSTPLLHIANRLEYSYWWFNDGSHSLHVESILKSVLLKYRFCVAFRWLLSRWMTLQWLQHPKVRFRTCWHLMLCVVSLRKGPWIARSSTLAVFERWRKEAPVVCWWSKKAALASCWLHSVAVTLWGETSLWWTGWLYTWNFNGWGLKFILKKEGNCTSTCGDLFSQIS